MNPTTLQALNRRSFLGHSAALTPVLFPFVLKGATGADAKNADTLKIGLVGCGGRGTGAAQQALSADYNTTLFAVADAFAEKAEASVKMLGDSFAKRVDVPKERQFIGLDAYQKLIDICDVVILASLPDSVRPIWRPLSRQASISFVRSPWPWIRPAIVWPWTPSRSPRRRNSVWWLATAGVAVRRVWKPSSACMMARSVSWLPSLPLTTPVR